MTKRFGDFTAVDRVDLSVRAGEFLTLLGPSGCGKTTVLRMISGLETPSDGVVLLDGRDVTHLPAYRRDVNQVFQSYALFPHLNVRDNVAFGLRMKRLPRREVALRVAEAIDLVALNGLANRKPDQLSGGQRQRVALARAVVNRPKVLLLDEPLAALDAKLRRGMQLELKRLQHRLGITFVFVTHDQEEALTMSDRIAVMNIGRIEQLGDVAQVYHKPTTPFVAAFVGQTNMLEMTAVSSDGATTRFVRGDVTVELPQRIGGDVVRVSIRPEKIRVTATSTGVASSSPNVFHATVVEELFRGEVDQLLLRTPAGVELTAVVANQSAMEIAVHRGDVVRCEVHPDDVVVVNEH